MESNKYVDAGDLERYLPSPGFGSNLPAMAGHNSYSRQDIEPLAATTNSFFTTKQYRANQR